MRIRPRIDRLRWSTTLLYVPARCERKATFLPGEAILGFALLGTVYLSSTKSSTVSASPGMNLHKCLVISVADVAELADALDSKSGNRKVVWVRPPPSAPIKRARLSTLQIIASVPPVRSNGPPPMGQEPQESREHHQGRHHAGGNAGGHDLSQAFNPLMVGQHKAAESRDRRQPRNEHGFACTFGQDGRFLLLGETV